MSQTLILQTRCDHPDCIEYLDQQLSIGMHPVSKDDAYQLPDGWSRWRHGNGCRVLCPHHARGAAQAFKDWTKSQCDPQDGGTPA